MFQNLEKFKLIRRRRNKKGSEHLLTNQVSEHLLTNQSSTSHIVCQVDETEDTLVNDEIKLKVPLLRMENQEDLYSDKVENPSMGNGDNLYLGNRDNLYLDNEDIEVLVEEDLKWIPDRNKNTNLNTNSKLTDLEIDPMHKKSEYKYDGNARVTERVDDKNFSVDNTPNDLLKDKFNTETTFRESNNYNRNFTELRKNGELSFIKDDRTAKNSNKFELMNFNVSIDACKVLDTISKDLPIRNIEILAKNKNKIETDINPKTKKAVKLASCKEQNFDNENYELFEEVNEILNVLINSATELGEMHQLLNEIVDNILKSDVFSSDDETSNKADINLIKIPKTKTKNNNTGKNKNFNDNAILSLSTEVVKESNKELETIIHTLINDVVNAAVTSCSQTYNQQNQLHVKIDNIKDDVDRNENIDMLEITSNNNQKFKLADCVVIECKVIENATEKDSVLQKPREVSSVEGIDLGIPQVPKSLTIQPNLNAPMGKKAKKSTIPNTDLSVPIKEILTPLKNMTLPYMEMIIPNIVVETPHKSTNDFKASTESFSSTKNSAFSPYRINTNSQSMSLPAQSMSLPAQSMSLPVQSMSLHVPNLQNRRIKSQSLRIRSPFKAISSPFKVISSPNKGKVTSLSSPSKVILDAAKLIAVPTRCALEPQVLIRQPNKAGSSPFTYKENLSPFKKNNVKRSNLSVGSDNSFLNNAIKETNRLIAGSLDIVSFDDKSSINLEVSTNDYFKTRSKSTIPLLSPDMAIMEASKMIVGPLRLDIEPNHVEKSPINKIKLKARELNYPYYHVVFVNPKSTYDKIYDILRQRTVKSPKHDLTILELQCTLDYTEIMAYTEKRFKRRNAYYPERLEKDFADICMFRNFRTQFAYSKIKK